MGSTWNLRTTTDQELRAGHPGELGRVGWRAALGRVGGEFKADGVMRLGAAVAYYLVLALVPGIVAAVSVLGLVSEPSEVVARLGELAASMPADTGDLVLLPTGVGQVLRFPLLLVVVLVLLAVLYRFTPDRADPSWMWVTPGAVVGALLWLVVTGGFTAYVETLGSYDDTYGSLAGVVVLLFWLQLTAVSCVIGAEVNAELERQTSTDTTTGPDRPMGERDAVAADYRPGVEPVVVDGEEVVVDTADAEER